MSNNSGGTFVQSTRTAAEDNIQPISVRHNLAPLIPTPNHGFQQWTSHDFHVGTAPLTQTNNSNGTWWRGFDRPATNMTRFGQIRDVGHADY